ncbi:MAG: O-phosphoseryl-tRNA(Sec) selenium transferase, partial [Promethearchaeota archaeon]
MLKNYLRDKLEDLIEKGILERGLIVLGEEIAPIKILLEQRAVPKIGWKDKQIKWFLELLSSMDTDKDPKAARVGEREGRVASDYLLSLCAG